jgi:hypothetical protein
VEGKPEGKSSFERARCMWKYNNKADVREII